LVLLTLYRCAGNTEVETDLTTEREKSCGEHSCVVRDKRVGIVGMTAYKNMEVDLIYAIHIISNLSFFGFVCSQDAPTLFFFWLAMIVSSSITRVYIGIIFHTRQRSMRVRLPK